MVGMKRRDLRYVSRTRTLSQEEILAIWDAAMEMGYPFGLVVQLLILTGQRRSEIAKLQRDWIAPDFIEFPEESQKTGVSQILPLTKWTKGIPQALPIWNGGNFVFSTTNGRSPVSGFSKTKIRLD